MVFDIEKMAADIMNEPLDAPIISLPTNADGRTRQLYSVITASQIKDHTRCELKALSDFPEYKAESENRNVIIKGRWLERGGSAWWISTAGTGKSIASIQLSLCWTLGLPFAGLTPNTDEGEGLRTWIIQSEDSPSRITIDREDVIAELKEQYPNANWNLAKTLVKFLIIGGKVGAEFLDKLDEVLDLARDRADLPDVIIINPFLAYIGGPINDGSYVTPFLRGGEINRQKTHGLQHILEKYNIGALIFHHTPKPPNEDDLEKWVKSTFPEYQGAGSADITNWGRSFVTMMRVKGESGMVRLTAGKNGGDLGWDIIDEAPRYYLAWSQGRGITGKGRHAWRELTDDEYTRVTNDSKARAANDVERIVSALKAQPMTSNQLMQKMQSEGMKQRAFKVAWKTVSAHYSDYDLVCAEAHRGRVKCWFFGSMEAARNAAWKYETETEND